MATQHNSSVTSVNNITERADSLSLHRQMAIEAFITEAAKMVDDPKDVPTDIYNNIGNAIAVAIEAYIAPLITANNMHKHKIVIEELGIDTVSDVSDTLIQ